MAKGGGGGGGSKGSGGAGGRSAGGGAGAGAQPPASTPLDKKAFADAGVKLGPGNTPRDIQNAWKSTFGQPLQHASEVVALSGLTKADLGKRGELKISVSPSGLFRITATAQGIDMSRTYRQGSVYHGHLFLGPSKQNNGLGSRIIRTQVASYQRLGIKKVSLDAAEVGRYVWPSLGFRVSRASLSQYRTSFHSYLQERGITPPAKIHSVQQIARFTHGGEKVGKAFLLSNAAPNMQSMQVRTARLAKALERR